MGAYVKQDCLKTANLSNPKHYIPDQLANHDGRHCQDAGAFHAIDLHGGGLQWASSLLQKIKDTPTRNRYNWHKGQ